MVNPGETSRIMGSLRTRYARHEYVDLARHLCEVRIHGRTLLAKLYMRSFSWNLIHLVPRAAFTQRDYRTTS